MDQTVFTNPELEALTPREREAVHNNLLAAVIMAGVILIVAAVAEMFAYEPGDFRNGLAFAPFVVFGISYCFIFFRLRHLPADARKGQKVVADTTVVRVKKWGWFDVDASEPGGAPQTAFGSVYYLYVKDASRKSGQRKFRVKMRVYNYLQPGDEVTIAYLPRSGILLSVDTGGFHYNALDRTQPTQ